MTNTLNSISLILDKQFGQLFDEVPPPHRGDIIFDHIKDIRSQLLSLKLPLQEALSLIPATEVDIEGFTSCHSYSDSLDLNLTFSIDHEQVEMVSYKSSIVTDYLFNRLSKIPSFRKIFAISSTSCLITFTYTL